MKKRIQLFLLAIAIATTMVGCTVAPTNVQNGASVANSSKASDSGELPSSIPTSSEVPSTPPQDDVTMGQKNALKKAKTYLDVTAFSLEGLIDQLKFDEYSQEEAEYGAKNCDADWNEQAVKKAKTYLDLMAFSRKELIDQLVFDKFTKEQATHGADANGY